MCCWSFDLFGLNLKKYRTKIVVHGVVRNMGNHNITNWVCPPIKNEQIAKKHHLLWV